ncbi:MAG: glycosyltransferase [Edaphobacter sp.]|uniref:glycosyltransferase n=1 Tax=Edaphobacter sp. TaxID=1934404 RepID=UPI0023A74073|nr:glycosyltransferase [Edaphobacter sp.]MDE1176974.1 glycosyltransferase [Edaphobacter sp.]
MKALGDTDFAIQATAPEIKPVELLAVIVLYKMHLDESKSYQSLMVAAENASLDVISLRVVLYDNTPGALLPPDLPTGVEYYHPFQNKGLAEAYNFAARIAEEKGCQWLLTLDQDTELPANFLSRMGEIAIKVANTPRVGAIVPHVVSGQRLLSPYWFWRGVTARWFRKDYVGIPDDAVFAFNSGTMVRVTALQQIHGYARWFWLDNSDTHMFYQLQRYGKSVYIAGDLQLEHNFSMLSIEKSMSLERYRNALSAESAFWDLDMGMLAGGERTLRLLVRYFRQVRSTSSKYRRVTGQFLLRRLFWTRRGRLAAWQKEMVERFGDSRPEIQPAAMNTRPLPLEPKISVCMAAYNGEEFVEKQLNSILSQLGSRDEVVIVEDKSTDRTLSVIQLIRDPRIRLIQHERNCGVVATFQEAMENATGDIIFLSDDDDIWAPDKVAKMLEAFRSDHSIQIVTSGVSLIDKDDNATFDEIYSNQVKFRPGFWKNVVVNRYQGSAMAFRATLLAHILPLPKNVEFLHDAWIGTSNDRIGGKVAYIDEPLLFYRRHPRNYSRQISLLSRLRWRYQLLREHLRFSLGVVR